jgi:hypothetical protein
LARYELNRRTGGDIKNVDCGAAISANSMC